MDQPANRLPKPPMPPDPGYLSLMSKTEMPSSTLSVSTRRGVITFTSTLEWNEAVALCREEATKGNDFARSLIEREDRNQYMSESQVSWVYKMAEDVRQLREPSPAKSAPRSVDASNILASVAEARARGIKKPVLRLIDPVGNDIRVKYMSMGKNAGGAWVTYNDDLIGKIDDCGEFTITNRSCSDRISAEMFDFIEITNHDVKGALESYGKMTSKCGCCGLPLTNEKSIELGIGPICLSKFGLLSFA